MNAELKKKWIEALRSGEYEQGRNYFEKAGKFCCLGVLCKVAGKPTTRAEDDVGNWHFAETTLPLGMDMRLATLNDKGSSFSEIADYIEAKIPADEHSHTD
ncbi:hypothetical protein [Afipia clevelandensis]|uniref:Uncharacterized protein n=1 Tax=Afipia clevelandensis ATCC 49720 TaxID=883079 RepID=K8P8H3_9BRAD|nr:hypothetical protein [Afipia clevelandensis]EKS37796.1 hypothetical protein HMPREF9696_01746 [Afipia clevelandensis ATCC 49720]